MTLCVRDEAPMLAANLAFHRALGVERAYVFLDGCTDGTADVAAAHPWVASVVVDPAERASVPRVSDLQRTLMARALGLARADGMDWLLGIDADEFVFGDGRGAADAPPGEAARRGDLRVMLGRIRTSIEAVRFPVLEALPAAADGAPLLGPGRAFLVANDFVREILDPSDATVHTWRGPFGHRWGKCAVRTSADAVPAGAHRWMRRGAATTGPLPEEARLRTTMAGRLYHFALNGPAHWLTKYGRFTADSDVRARGREVALPKRCWKRAAATLGPAEAEAYYARWVALPGPRHAEILRQGAAVVDDTVARVLSEAGAAASAEAPDPSRRPCPAA